MMTYLIIISSICTCLLIWFSIIDDGQIDLFVLFLCLFFGFIPVVNVLFVVSFLFHLCNNGKAPIIYKRKNRN